MFVHFVSSSEVNDFKLAFEDTARRANSIIVLACDENNYVPNEINPILENCAKPVIGGIFPAIMHNDKKYDKGVLIIGLENRLDVSIVPNLSLDGDFSAIVESQIGELASEVKTMFVFVDGLSKNIAKIVDALFDNFGLSVNYVGGGAGSLSFEQKPVIFTNYGLLKDCAVLASSTLKSGVGVKHGWEIVSDAYKVTKVDANVVYELDYRDAFDVYKEIVEKDSNQKFNDDNFFDISKSYPFGINKLSGEMVVRDPIVLQGKALVCVGEVPENAFVNILKGKNASLIGAAKEAYEESVESIQSDVDTFTFFIDCISRVLFLEEDFDKEIKAANGDESVLVGALTLGEIANNKKHYLEFYNKTAVVAKIENG